MVPVIPTKLMMVDSVIPTKLMMVDSAIRAKLMMVDSVIPTKLMLVIISNIPNRVVVIPEMLVDSVIPTKLMLVIITNIPNRMVVIPVVDMVDIPVVDMVDIPVVDMVDIPMVDIPVVIPNMVVKTVIWPTQMTLWIRIIILFILMIRRKKMVTYKQMSLHGYQFRDQPRSGSTNATMTFWDQFWDNV